MITLVMVIKGKHPTLPIVDLFSTLLLDETPNDYNM
jgi:hypothetical protein